MRNSKSISMVTFQVVSMLVGLIFIPSVMAECIQSDPPADTILAIDANNGCADIQGQVGCQINKWDRNGYADCTYSDDEKSFKVVSLRDDQTGGVSWSLDSTESSIYGIDTAVFGGGNQGKNNCGYVYNFDVDKGNGGDCTDDPNNCTKFQNITSLSICTDGQNDIDITPPPPEVAFPLPSCSATGYKLDATGIECPKYTTDEHEDALEACDPNGSEECPTFAVDDEKPVVVCNLEKDKEDWGTTDGSDVCCQCGIPVDDQTACVVTEKEIPGVNVCTKSMTVNPTQSVELMFFKDDVDPCTWIRTRKGWQQYCY